MFERWDCLPELLKDQRKCVYKNALRIPVGKCHPVSTVISVRFCADWQEEASNFKCQMHLSPGPRDPHQTQFTKWWSWEESGKVGGCRLWSWDHMSNPAHVKLSARTCHLWVGIHRANNKPTLPWGPSEVEWGMEVIELSMTSKSKTLSQHPQTSVPSTTTTRQISIDAISLPHR